MKSMRPPSAAIFFMTYFHRAKGEGAWPSRPPPDPLLLISDTKSNSSYGSENYASHENIDTEETYVIWTEAQDTSNVESVILYFLS